MKPAWGKQSSPVEGVSYTCGYCGRDVGPLMGYVGVDGGGNEHWIYICPVCYGPTFRARGTQVPGVRYGSDVAELPSDVEALYGEARACMTVTAHTAAVLTSRKLLMHIAVEKGASAGKPFIDYVQYLADNGYVPPDGKDWVDQIRKQGNEANHEIKQMSREEAEELISFLEMLLKFVYEFPGRIKQKQKP